MDAEIEKDIVRVLGDQDIPSGWPPEFSAAAWRPAPVAAAMRREGPADQRRARLLSCIEAGVIPGLPEKLGFRHAFGSALLQDRARGGRAGEEMGHDDGGGRIAAHGG
jgi:hypothetical protein